MCIINFLIPDDVVRRDELNADMQAILEEIARTGGFDDTYSTLASLTAAAQTSNTLDPKKIYLIPLSQDDQEEKNIYAEYLYKETNSTSHTGIVEALGSTEIDLDSKQDTLVSGENIKTINNESILGSGNLDIQSMIMANEEFPDGGHKSGTMANLISDINNDTNAIKGKIYLSTVSFSDLPASLMQAEMKCEIIEVDQSLGKNILFTITSSNRAPYHGEYTSAGGSTGTWRSWATSDQLNTKLNGTGITNIVKLTQSEYDLLSVKDANTLYIASNVYTGPVTGLKFGNIKFADGILAYENGQYTIKSGGINDSYGTVHGKVEGSTYFNFIDIGQLFEKVNFDETDGDISNLLNPLNGWRLPTYEEFSTLITTDSSVRSGATVNGNTHKHGAAISVHFDSNIRPQHNMYKDSAEGYLIFPDNATIIGETIVSDDNDTLNSLTDAQLNVYLSQGCVFLPNVGYAATGEYATSGLDESWEEGMITFMTSTEASPDAYCVLYGRSSDSLDVRGGFMKVDHYCPVGLVRSEQSINEFRLYLGDLPLTV